MGFEDQSEAPTVCGSKVGGISQRSVQRLPSGTSTETPEERAKKEQADRFLRLNKLQETHPDLAAVLRYTNLH